MAIVGFGFDKINAEKKLNKLPRDSKIESGINITNVEEDSLKVGTAEGILKVKYKFSVDYKPGFGVINLEGYLLYMPKESNEKKEIMDEWSKNKKINPNLVTVFINFILSRVHIKSLELGQDLGLPPHLPLPHIKPQNEESSKKSEYIG